VFEGLGKQRWEERAHRTYLQVILIMFMRLSRFNSFIYNHAARLLSDYDISEEVTERGHKYPRRFQQLIRSEINEPAFAPR
jgi:hypothetical protein